MAAEIWLSYSDNGSGRPVSRGNSGEELGKHLQSGNSFTHRHVPSSRLQETVSTTEQTLLWNTLLKKANNVSHSNWLTRPDKKEFQKLFISYKRSEWKVINFPSTRVQLVSPLKTRQKHFSHWWAYLVISWKLWRSLHLFWVQHKSLVAFPSSFPNPIWQATTCAWHAWEWELMAFMGPPSAF